MSTHSLATGNPAEPLSGPAGASGAALPFALAARTLFPVARIAATMGDGTFGFHPLEIDTAVRHDLPFVAVIGNVRLQPVAAPVITRH